MSRTAIDWNSIPLHIKEIEDKDKFKAAVAQYFSQEPVFTAKELHQPYSFHPF